MQYSKQIEDQTKNNIIATYQSGKGIKAISKALWTPENNSEWHYKQTEKHGTLLLQMACLPKLLQEQGGWGVGGVIQHKKERT